MLIAFEGIDGSGKNTQAKKLADRISNHFHTEWLQANMKGPARGATLVSFPRYTESVFGDFIRRYLQGKLGDLYDNDPLLVSLLYALDRYEFRPQLERRLAVGDVVICDRYVASNMAHQGAKIYAGRSRARIELLNNIERTEHGVLGLPKPDLVFLLDLSAEQSFQRTHKRDEESDLHQDNRGYLSDVRDIYLDLADTYRSWHVVNCFDKDEQPRTVDDLHEEIWGIVLAKLNSSQQGA